MLSLCFNWQFNIVFLDFVTYVLVCWLLYLQSQTQKYTEKVKEQNDSIKVSIKKKISTTRNEYQEFLLMQMRGSNIIHMGILCIFQYFPSPTRQKAREMQEMSKMSAILSLKGLSFPLKIFHLQKLMRNTIV